MTDFRIIPSIEHLRQREAVRDLEREFGRVAIVEALRAAAADLRARLAASGGEAAGPADAEVAAREIEGRAHQALVAAGRPSLRRLVNATGIVVHTNLGRAPLADLAIERLRGLAGCYSNLEFDLEAGRRGSRDTHAEALLTRLLGADAAVVVNNNAGATLLMLAALAAGREVIVSRGELVEIGGGFRLPEVMAQSGARLREVGTTNRTHLKDYAEAIDRGAALDCLGSASRTLQSHRTVLLRAALSGRIPTQIFRDLIESHYFLFFPGFVAPIVQCVCAALVERFALRRRVFREKIRDFFHCER